MSVFNCCKQILEIEQKNEDLMVQEDQISLMNEAIFKYLDKIESLENELNNVKKLHNLSFMRAVNIDILPAILSSKTELQMMKPWPDLR